MNTHIHLLLLYRIQLRRYSYLGYSNGERVKSIQKKKEANSPMISLVCKWIVGQGKFHKSMTLLKPKNRSCS